MSPPTSSAGATSPDLREALAATGGTEVKTIGDAVMASYTGAADALAGAVAMQWSVERHNRRAKGPALAMRIGISAGDATFEDGDWFGTPVIEASRLCGAADGGQILVSDLVRALAGSRTDHEVRSLGARELKGLPEPVAVSEVVWSAAVDTSVLPLPEVVETTLGVRLPGAGGGAGRCSCRRGRRSSAGDRRLVLVSGEPGIGKTRLVTEAVRVAHAEGGTILWGRCDAELGVPFEPFAEALRRYTSAVSAQRLRRELGPLAGELTRLLPELSARVPGLPEPLPAEPEAERHRLFEAVVDLLAASSDNAPLVLVLDDLHWADKPSLLLLRHVLRSVTADSGAHPGDLPRHRPRPQPSPGRRPRRPAAGERRDAAGPHGSGRQGGRAAHGERRRSRPGRPRARAGQGGAQRDRGQPVLRRPDAAAPGRVRADRAARRPVDQRRGARRPRHPRGHPRGRGPTALTPCRMWPTTRSSWAAVIGAEFDLAIVEAAGGPSGDALLDALDEATRAGVLREVGGAVGRYRFAHALVRSALHEEISTNRRVRMHWQRRRGDRGSEWAAAPMPPSTPLAYHYGEGALAGDPEKAVDVTRRAATKATTELAFEAAVGHLDRALGLLELFDRPALELRCDLLLDLATALRDAGDPRRRADRLRRRGGGPDPWRSPATRSGRSDPGSLRHDDGGRVRQRGASSPSTRRPSPACPTSRRRCGLGSCPRSPSSCSGEGTTIVGGELASEALEMARAIGDGPTLNVVLATAWATLDGRERFAEQWVEHPAGGAGGGRAGARSRAGSFDALLHLIGTQAAARRGGRRPSRASRRPSGSPTGSACPASAGPSSTCGPCSPPSPATSTGPSGTRWRPSSRSVLRPDRVDDHRERRAACSSPSAATRDGSASWSRRWRTWSGPSPERRSGELALVAALWCGAAAWRRPGCTSIGWSPTTAPACRATSTSP